MCDRSEREREALLTIMCLIEWIYIYVFYVTLTTIQMYYNKIFKKQTKTRIKYSSSNDSIVKVIRIALQQYQTTQFFLWTTTNVRTA